MANEATKILHGDKASKKAELTARETFEGSGFGSDLPEIKINSNDINKGISLLDLITNNKIMSSKSEVRRAIMNRGIKIDNVIVQDDKKLISREDFKSNVLKISHGKKKHYLIKIV